MLALALCWGQRAHRGKTYHLSPWDIIRPVAPLLSTHWLLPFSLLWLLPSGRLQTSKSDNGYTG